MDYVLSYLISVLIVSIKQKCISEPDTDLKMSKSNKMQNYINCRMRVILQVRFIGWNLSLDPPAQKEAKQT